MADESVIKTSIYLQRDLLKKLKDLAFERHSSVNAIVIEAIEQEYARPVVPLPIAASPHATSRHQQLIDKLIHILDSDSQDAIEAVTKNVNVFHRIVLVDQQKKRSRKRDEHDDNPGKLTG